MKKLLLATMLATAFATAQAQSNDKPNDAIATPNAPVQSSSVSVYGIVDVGFIGTNYQGVGTTPKVSQSTSAFGQSAESTSRLGFKGTEDLGGGTSAFFTVETGLQPTNATVSTWDNRQSFVGLKQAGLGQASIGTQYTPIHSQAAVTDAGQLNNMPGSLVYASNVQAQGNPGTAPFAAPSSPSGSSAGYTVRTSNTLNIASERYAGFQGAGFIVQNGTDSTTGSTSTTTNGVTTVTPNGGQVNYNGYGINANYTWDKLYVTAVAQNLKSVISAATLTTPAPAIWTTAGGGVNTQDNQKYVAATYDFGVLKAYAQYITRKATDTINTNYYASRTAQQIGVRGNFTPNIEGWASAGNGKVRTFGATAPTSNFVGYQAGANYYLSKRTNLYAIVGQTKTDSSSVTGIPLSSTGYAAGVRHTF